VIGAGIDVAALGRLAPVPPANRSSGGDPADPAEGYRPRAGVHDEMLDAEGRLREPWRPLIDRLRQMGPADVLAARESAVRLMRENGAAFNVYADPEDRAFRWRLRTMPILLGRRDWELVAAGVAQRAQVIDRALADLYGEATLLHEGVIPPALVLGSEQFVRAAVDRTGPGRPMVQLYACDLARNAAGGWTVLADQVEAPSGMGYALANRVALTHGFAELFRAMGATRLVGFFTALQDSLAALAGREDARVVVLGPVPADPGYFGHAYLARYLGYTLVETADLTVRDERLFMKTLDGLQRVDLVIRQLPAAGCDPLELPDHAGAGVPGLLRAVRKGTVRMINAPGSGLANNRALGPFMQALCRRFADSEPLLAESSCLWLGEPAARAQVLAEPGTWRLELATARNEPGDAARTVDLQTLEPGARAGFVAMLERHGHRWVAQRPVPLATTPAWDNDRLVPMPFAMRVFAAATADGWRVMPGALVRFAGDPTAVGLPNGFGAGDLWVLDEGKGATQPSLLQRSLASAHLRRTGRDLLSRTADNLFWLGRYAERADGLMRLLRAVLLRLVEDTRLGSEPPLLARILAIALSKAQLPPPDLGARPPLQAIEAEAVRVLYDPSVAYGMRETLGHVQRTATLVRDQISHDAWRALAVLFADRAWRQRQEHVVGPGTLDLLDVGLRQLTAFAGTEAENMTRNFAWRFLEMGRRLERASQMVDLLRGLVPTADEADPPGTLPVLLELADSAMTYRSRYLARPLVLPTLDLLLLDESNPRAIAFQMAALAEHIEQLPGSSGNAGRTPEQRLTMRLLTDLRLAEIERLGRDERGTAELTALLQQLARGLPQLSDLLGAAYFAHVEPAMTGSLERGAEQP
jgi:uncharacterized circularly permuted ATP-grasp superfamily protein/uncharacterized alpha-E superfamily protein